jgi:hypothetical protein
MNPLLLAAGLLLSSSQAEPGPPYFYCEVTRTVPYGNVTVLQYVNPAGSSEPPVTTWFAERGTWGTVLLAAWDSKAEMEDSVQGGELYFGYQPQDRSGQYRVEISRAGAAAEEPVHRSELQTPSANGLVGLRMRWSPVVALLANGAELEVRVLAADGSVVRRDRVGGDEFDRALSIAGEIQPEFEAMAANYRERCRPTDSNGRR